MVGLITSCGRFDLLDITLRTLASSAKGNGISFVVHEDKERAFLPKRKWDDYQESIPIVIPNLFEENGSTKSICVDVLYKSTNGIRQHKSIEKFLSENDSKYYLHCEDDWSFDSPAFDWVHKSIEIMESDPKIIKVLCRKDSPHNPINFKDGWGYLNNWFSQDGILWRGFSWNPGVTRLDLLKQFVPFRKWEQGVAEDIYNAGYRVAMLEKGVCRHIGDGRSTH